MWINLLAKKWKNKFHCTTQCQTCQIMWLYLATLTVCVDKVGADSVDNRRLGWRYSRQSASHDCSVDRGWRYDRTERGPRPSGTPHRSGPYHDMPDNQIWCAVGTLCVWAWESRLVCQRAHHTGHANYRQTLTPPCTDDHWRRGADRKLEQPDTSSNTASLASVHLEVSWHDRVPGQSQTTEYSAVPD